MLNDILPKEESNSSIRERGIKTFEGMLTITENYLRERPREEKTNKKNKNELFMDFDVLEVKNGL